MVYAYDQWAQLPVKDLYDTQMMAMSIQAAKDMYEKGLQEIKDFKKEYGDFYSPVASDNAWYSQNVTGKVRDTINSLYASGIDPVRSAEGRAAINRVINSIDTGAIADKKRAALAAEQYVKSRDALIRNNTFNPEYEKQMLGGQTLETWDGSLGNWTATSASPYLDYEQKYGHLFDKMGFEYDPEESKKHPGMLVSTKNKARMHDILSASRPDLVNDPQYKYDLENLKQSIAIQNPNMSQSDIDNLAVRTLEDEIVERNYKGGMQMQEDPIAKEERAFKNNVALEGIRHKHAMQEAAMKQGNKGDGTNNSGSYSNIISNAAAAKLSAHKSILASRIPKKEMDRIQKIKDPEKQGIELHNLEIRAWDDYLWNVGKNEPGGSIGSRIAHLHSGQKGTHVLNDILSHRSVGGNIAMDAQYILPMSGFEKDADGWFNVSGGGKVVSAHQIMRNILTYEAPEETNSRQKLIDNLKSVEDDDDLWIHASTKERVDRTRAVKPQTGGGNGYIVAPDENGIPTVYMKVQIKQGATSQIGSWRPKGEHSGFWVKTSITQIPGGQVSLESVPSMYGQEAQERHDLSNAGVSQSYEDARF